MQLTFLRDTFGINGPLLMYVGNLERYQGIDLLLESFRLILPQVNEAHLVIIGGTCEAIAQYQKRSQALDIHGHVHFAGQRPVEHLGHYLAQADVLVSPRIQGNNTPMKLYSYLDSGKALLATDLPTHTQVLNRQVAWLASPTVEDFSQGMLHLIQDEKLREQLGSNAQTLIAQNHTYEVFAAKLMDLYDWLQLKLTGDSAPSGVQVANGVPCQGSM